MFTQDHLQELLALLRQRLWRSKSLPRYRLCALQPAETTKLQVKGMLKELNGSNEDDAKVIERYPGSQLRLDQARIGSLFMCS